MKTLIVLVLALAACGNDDRGSRASGKKPNTDVVQVTVKKYAFEAYPQWSMVHPEKACPAKLVELDEWMNERDAKDPWGNDYVMYCGANLPPGAKGLAVSSNGPDGKPDTADDIKSW